MSFSLTLISPSLPRDDTQNRKSIAINETGKIPPIIAWEDNGRWENQCYSCTGSTSYLQPILLLSRYLVSQKAGCVWAEGE